MYTGHLGIALAAKGVQPRVPLWVFVVATQACDWVDAAVWPFGHADPHSSRWLVAGHWTAQMVSHSLPSVLAIAIVLSGIYYVATRNGSGSWLVAGVTLSHVLADYVTAEKPTWPGGPRVGLSLYRHPAADFVLEAGVVCGGWLLYRRSLQRGRNTTPAWMMLGLLVALQLVVNAMLRRALGTA